MTAERKLSRGEATHRRKVLSGARKSVPPDFVEQIISQSQKDQARIKEINEILENRNNLNPQQRAEFTAEMIWLKRKLNPNDRTYSLELNNFLENLRQQNPEVYDWLMREDVDGFTRLTAIRDQVIPRKKVGEYYTKRGR